MKCSRLRCDKSPRRNGLCHQHWELGRQMGNHGLTSSKAARVHVRRLRELQWSWIGIAAASGVCAKAITNLFHQESVRKSTERALLAVPLELFDSRKVTLPAVGLGRRREALARMGWPLPVVAEMAEATPQAVCNAIARGRVSVRLHERFAAVYEKLQNVPGPSQAIVKRAVERGVHPPMAWEFVDIDDPKSRPYGGFARSA